MVRSKLSEENPVVPMPQTATRAPCSRDSSHGRKTTAFGRSSSIY